MTGLAYDRVGSGEHTLLLLHPAFGHRGYFVAEVERFASRFRVLAVDLPGHGDNVPGPGEAWLTMDQAAAELVALLDQEGVAAAHVVGVSMGSLVAQDLARRFPARVSSLTVLGGYAVTDPLPQRAQRWEIVRWLPRVLFSMRGFRQYVARKTTHTAQGRTQFEALAERFGRSNFRGMRGTEVILDAGRTDALACPLCILVGEYDTDVLHEACKRWQDEVPGSRLTILPGAGHCANLDDAAGFAMAFETFLDAVLGEDSTERETPGQYP